MVYLACIDRDKITTSHKKNEGVGSKAHPFFPRPYYVYSDDGVAAGLPNVGTMATTARSTYAVHKSPNNGRMCAVRNVIGRCIAAPLAKYVINRRAKH